MSDSFDFPVEIVWPGGTRIIASVPGKSSLEITAPVELKGTHHDRWTVGDFVISAVASCYALTLIAIAERGSIPLHALAVNAGALVERERPGCFEEVELQVIASTEPGHEGDLCRAAIHAEASCLASTAVRIPFRLTFLVEPAAELAVTER